jgi:hypothetical protein
MDLRSILRTFGIFYGQSVYSVVLFGIFFTFWFAALIKSGNPVEDLDPTFKKIKVRSKKTRSVVYLEISMK